MSKNIKQELIIFRNLVDDTLYGTKHLREIAKRKYNLDKGDIGTAVACATRDKIYNDFLDIIYLMRKGEFPIERTMLLDKRIKIHINQIKMLKQPNAEDNRKGLLTLLHWVKLTQIKQQTIKDPSKFYLKLIK